MILGLLYIVTYQCMSWLVFPPAWLSQLAQTEKYYVKETTLCNHPRYHEILRHCTFPSAAMFFHAKITSAAPLIEKQMSLTHIQLGSKSSFCKYIQVICSTVADQ